MSTFSYVVDGERFEADDASMALHRAAEAILAKRGLYPGMYDEKEYLEACNVAHAQASAPPEEPVTTRYPGLDKALEELGYQTSESQTVTEQTLWLRHNEILAERGFTGRMSDVSEAESVDAYKQAIDELGLPGEERKDRKNLKALPGAKGAVAPGDVGQAIADGFKAGKIGGEEAKILVKMMRVSREDTIRVLREDYGLLGGTAAADVEETPPSPYRDPAYAAAAHALTYKVDGRTYDPDEASVRLHMAAEAWLKAEGRYRADREPHYTEDEYSRAVEAVDRARRRAAGETTQPWVRPRR